MPGWSLGTVCQWYWSLYAAKLQMVVYRNRPWHQNHHCSDRMRQVWMHSNVVTLYISGQSSWDIDAVLPLTIEMVYGCLFNISRQGAAGERMWGVTLSALTDPNQSGSQQTSRPNRSPASQHRAARKHTVFNEADLGTQVFLESTHSERKHLRMGEKKT